MAAVLEGKTLIFTDIHFGLKQNSVSRLNVCIKVIKQIISYIKEEGIQNVLFAGDLYHERVSVNVNTLNVALKCISAVAKHCKTYLIVGNHDAHYKNSVDVNSLNMFKDMANVVVVSKPEEVILNGQRVLLCPWLTDFSNYKKEQFDILVGHFDVSPKFLIASYIEDNSKGIAAGEDLVKQLQSDELLSTTSLAAATSEDFKAAEEGKQKASDLVGDFVECAKVGGAVFAGHIHQHKELVSKRRDFVFVGSPYEQTRGDRGNLCGFYVLDEKNKRKFIPVTGTPKHIELRMSDVLAAGIDSFDFSPVRGNIVHKVYDVDVDRLSDSKIAQKVTDYKPYEELIPEYEVSIDYGSGVSLQNESIQLIKKSKLEYIKNYIDNIDKKLLEEQQIDPDKLYSMLEDYYSKVAEH